MYLGVKLDRTLTYKSHLENLSGKLNARNALVRKVAGTNWGANSHALRTSSLALVYSVADYCAPVWGRSVHTKKIDVCLNNTMRTITGCLRPTPVHDLPVLSGIPPPDLRREEITAKLALKAKENPKSSLHQVMLSHPSSTQRLKSRRPFSRQAHELLANGHRTTDKWRGRWANATSRLKQFVGVPSASLPAGANLPRKQWVTLNRLRTGVGRFGAPMKKWGLAVSSACVCGCQNQTAEHVIMDCEVLRPPYGIQGLATLDPDTEQWLSQLEAEFCRQDERRSIQMCCVGENEDSLWSRVS